MKTFDFCLSWKGPGQRIFIVALVPGQMDSVTRNFFVPGQRDGRTRKFVCPGTKEHQNVPSWIVLLGQKKIPLSVFGKNHQLENYITTSFDI